MEAGVDPLDGLNEGEVPREPSRLRLELGAVEPPAPLPVGREPLQGSQLVEHAVLDLAEDGLVRRRRRDLQRARLAVTNETADSDRTREGQAADSSVGQSDARHPELAAADSCPPSLAVTEIMPTECMATGPTWPAAGFPLICPADRPRGGFRSAQPRSRSR